MSTTYVRCDRCRREMDKEVARQAYLDLVVDAYEYCLCEPCGRVVLEAVRTIIDPPWGAPRPLLPEETIDAP